MDSHHGRAAVSLNVHRQSGLTLLELLVAVAILMAVFFFIPVFIQPILHQNQLQTAISELKHMVTYARNQALIQDKPVVLALKDRGMTLFRDNGSQQLQDASQIIYAWANICQGCQCSWHGMQSNHTLFFSPSMRKNILNGHFIVRNKSGCYQLVVNRLGMSRAQVCPK